MHLLLRKGMRIFAVATAFALVLGAAAVAGVKVSGFKSGELEVVAGNTGKFEVCATVKGEKKCVTGKNMETLTLKLVADLKGGGEPQVQVATAADACAGFAAATVPVAGAKVSLVLPGGGSLKATLEAKAAVGAEFGGSPMGAGTTKIEVLIDKILDKADADELVDLVLCFEVKEALD